MVSGCLGRQNDGITSAWDLHFLSELEKFTFYLLKYDTNDQVKLIFFSVYSKKIIKLTFGGNSSTETIITISLGVRVKKNRKNDLFEFHFMDLVDGGFCSIKDLGTLVTLKGVKYS